MRRLTEAQVAVLLWCPDEGYRHWGGKLTGAPSMAAMKACLRRGWIARTGHPSMDLYRREPAGRLALAEQEARDA